MTDELVQRTQKYLFAEEEELTKARLPQKAIERMLRLRTMYGYWVANPRLADKEIVAELKRRYGIGPSVAYEDVRLIKVCIGNLNRCTSDYYRWLFTQRCEESFRMAREKGDAKAFAATLAALGKYTRLDKDEGNVPDYSLIVPQTFEISADPEVAGFKRIPNLDEKIKQMESRYIQEITAPAEAEFEEVKPLKPEIPHVPPVRT